MNFTIISAENSRAVRCRAQAKNAADDAETLKFLHADARDDLKSIVKKRTMKLENGFACFPDNDPLQKYIQNVKPLKTYFDVAMHGAPNAVGFGTAETNMSPRLLASVIRHSDGWNGQKIGCYRAAPASSSVMIIALLRNWRTRSELR